MPNQLRPTDAVAFNPYIDSLLKKARDEYGFVNLHNPVVDVGSGNGYAETYIPGDVGSKSEPRPENFPVDKTGIMVFKPNDFTHHDLAGELLHVDPYANEVRGKLLNSMTDKQKETLKNTSGDYSYSIKLGMSEDDALRNATDAAIRGYTIGQWPKDANDALGYTKPQTDMLNSLQDYMKTGKR